MLFSVLGILAVVLVLKLMGKTVKTIWKFAVNGVIGAIVLYALNAIGIPVAINWLTALLVGFFGLPAVVILVLAALL